MHIILGQSIKIRSASTSKKRRTDVVKKVKLTASTRGSKLKRNIPKSTVVKSRKSKVSTEKDVDQDKSESVSKSKKKDLTPRTHVSSYIQDPFFEAKNSQITFVSVSNYSKCSIR